ncbi:hypothetical protein Pla175_26400 [Pirellulimonas nuda]|uniref:Ice-binding protein C-terminal domain-containing protein n=1 Tax=Pirellulimonas nuda TaxID=2528009 RepID=A0A518DCR7_9BACT|nr:PEP-CTERM sorting domain-containing protein [Pirellulimonas nuda]QDU89253.1 hypothetical protein Pla175_26400 [Pirellulimonas nuda]
MTAAVFAATLGGAQAAIWTGGGDGTSYEQDLNWDVVEAFPGSTRDINGAFTVTRAVDTNTNRTFVNGGAVLNVTAGNHDDSQSGAGIFNFVGDGSAGTTNLSGGVYAIGHGLRIGGGNEFSDGAFHVTGGELSVYRDANSSITPGNPAGRSSIQVGGQVAGSSGVFEVSGGSVVSRFGAHVGSTGVFSVVGSGATSINIGNNINGDGDWITRAGSLLKASIDAGGLTPIMVNDNADDGAGITVEIEDGSLLDLSFSGIAPVAGTWTVLVAENADIEWNSATGTGVGGIGGVTGYTLGLALSPSTAPGWSFAVDNSGANGLLTATYAVPEPSSLALLMLGGLFALQGRRRS